MALSTKTERTITEKENRMALSTKTERTITETITWLNDIAIKCDADVRKTKDGGWSTQNVDFVTNIADNARRRAAWLQQILDDVDP